MDPETVLRAWMGLETVLRAWMDLETVLRHGGSMDLETVLRACISKRLCHLATHENSILSSTHANVMLVPFTSTHRVEHGSTCIVLSNNKSVFACSIFCLA